MVERFIDMSEVRVSQRWRPVVVWLAVAGAYLLAACSNGGQGGASSGTTPTPLPTPAVPEKPLYTVEQGTVVNTLEFTGRVSPVLEQELFFKSDGFVADVFVARGDQVDEDDLLAELEIGDLQNRLAQQHLALRTADIFLKSGPPIRTSTKISPQPNIAFGLINQYQTGK